jgi:hypothetical protein
MASPSARDQGKLPAEVMTWKRGAADLNLRHAAGVGAGGVLVLAFGL